jgi:hypothetical protein
MAESDVEEGEVFEEEAPSVPSPPQPSKQNSIPVNKPEDKRNYFPTLPAKRKRTEPKPIPRKICKYWAAGSCQKGEECTYLHEPRREQKEELCKYFLTNCCVKGSDCIYSHDTKKFPCKYLHGTGYCQAGKDCRFSHVRLTQEQIPKFIRDNEAFLHEVFSTMGYTNLREYYLQYLNEKGVPVMPTTQSYPWLITPPKPPSPDLSTRLHSSGIVKTKSLTVPDPNKLAEKKLNSSVTI